MQKLIQELFGVPVKLKDSGVWLYPQTVEELRQTLKNLWCLPWDGTLARIVVVDPVDGSTIEPSLDLLLQNRRAKIGEVRFRIMSQNVSTQILENSDKELVLLNRVFNSNERQVLVRESTGQVLAVSHSYCEFTRRSLLDWLQDTKNNERWDQSALAGLVAEMDKLESEGSPPEVTKEYRAIYAATGEWRLWKCHFERLRDLDGNSYRLTRVLSCESVKAPDRELSAAS